MKERRLGWREGEGGIEGEETGMEGGREREREGESNLTLTHVSYLLSYDFIVTDICGISKGDGWSVGRKKAIYHC